MRCRGDKIVVDMVVTEKICELDNEVREIFLRRMRKEFTGVIQGISGKKRFLVRFQYGCEKYLTSNQLAIVILQKSLVEEETKVHMIPEIPKEQVTPEKGYYHDVYVILHFNKEEGVDRK